MKPYQIKVSRLFPQDHQGRRFLDVLNDPRINFLDILHFFDDEARQQRMVESEIHHDRPALAGVIRELESRGDVQDFFQTNPHTTARFKQALGVIARIIMEQRGWSTTGQKGSLRGLSRWLTRAERYRRSSTAQPENLVAQSP